MDIYGSFFKAWNLIGDLSKRGVLLKLFQSVESVGTFSKRGKLLKLFSQSVEITGSFFKAWNLLEPSQSEAWI